MTLLIPCPQCNRHVRRSESACPFCGTSVSAAIAATPERAVPLTRMSRSALAMFAAASVGAVSCSDDQPAAGTGRPGAKGDAALDGASHSGTGGYLATPVYGAPAPTGGVTGAGGRSNAGGTTNVGGAGGRASTGGKTSGDGGYTGSTGGNVGSGGLMAVPAYGISPYTGGAPGAGGKPSAGGVTGAGGKGSGGGFAPVYGGPPHTIYGAPPAPDTKK